MSLEALALESMRKGCLEAEISKIEVEEENRIRIPPGRLWIWK